MKYLFGPVQSRRLGLSLGIDLVPHKTCTLNCIYCECGPTTLLTSEIREYVPTVEVLHEIDQYLSDRPVLDVITFSGSGEPTLHSRIGEIITHIKEAHAGYRVAVLTNGTLLWDARVRENLMNADIVIPSLDAINEETFRIVLRPHMNITPERMMEGLMQFGKDFKGRYILEVFIIPGINTSVEELTEIKNACSKIRHNEIHLNTLDRPGTVKWVKPASMEEMDEIEDFFRPLNVKVIGSPGMLEMNLISSGKSDDIISIIKRRPSTAEELNHITGIPMDELSRLLEKLEKSCVIKGEKLERGLFYRLF